jgi:CHASE2 domain-containing sensor protein
MRKTKKDTFSGAFLLSFFLAIFLLLSYSRVFDGFEYNTFDFRYKLRPAREVSQDIVIIEISDDSIEKIGEWPFPRNYHSLMIRALDSSGAKAIIFDIFFSEMTPEDEEFAISAFDAGNVYFPYIFSLDADIRKGSGFHARGYAADLIAPLKKAARGKGFANVIPDDDGKVRRMPLFAEYDGEKYPLLSFIAALDSMGLSFEDIDIRPGKHIKIGEEETIPIDDDSFLLVNYAGKWGESFRHFSYVDILQSYLADVTGQQATLDLSELEGAVCFIGVTASASPDAHPSPIENMYPGVGVHAGIYDSIVSGRHIMRLSRGANLIILLILGFLTACSTLKLKKRFAGFAMLAISGGYFLFSVIAFWPFGIWLDMFYPLVSVLVVYFAATFKKYIEETQKREMIEKELNMAKEIQESFLPKTLPELKGMEISVKMITAKQVGGDLYDIIDLGGGKVGIMMGDVSGKGFPAALYMAKATSVFKTYIGDHSPAEAVKKTNDRLAMESSSGLFVTLSYMVFDTALSKVDLSIGGHLPTILIEPGGNVELLDVESGLPLGMMECDFSEVSREYLPGSVFVLYTDGVTEAMNVKGDMYSLERLTEFCRALSGRSSEYVVEAIHRDVALFAGKADQHDDITVMAVKA